MFEVRAEGRPRRTRRVDDGAPRGVGGRSGCAPSAAISSPQRCVCVGCSCALAPRRSFRRSLTRWPRVVGANVKTLRSAWANAIGACRRGVSGAPCNGREVLGVAPSWPHCTTATSTPVRVHTSNPRPTSRRNARVVGGESPSALSGRGARGSGGEVARSRRLPAFATGGVTQRAATPLPGGAGGSTTRGVECPIRIRLARIRAASRSARTFSRSALNSPTSSASSPTGANGSSAAPHLAPARSSATLALRHLNRYGPPYSENSTSVTSSDPRGIGAVASSTARRRRKSSGGVARAAIPASAKRAVWSTARPYCDR